MCILSEYLLVEGIIFWLGMLARNLQVRPEKIRAELETGWAWTGSELKVKLD